MFNCYDYCCSGISKNKFSYFYGDYLAMPFYIMKYIFYNQIFFLIVYCPDLLLIYSIDGDNYMLFDWKY